VLFLYKFFIFISCIYFFFFCLFWVSAFELTYVSSTAAPQPAHTHARCVRPYRGKFDRGTPSTAHTQARLRSNLPCKFERIARCTFCARHECGRPHLGAVERTRAGAVFDLFLGHIFPIPPHFPIPAARLFPSPSPFPHLKSPPNIQITAAHHLPTTSRPFTGPSPTSPPTASRPLAGILSFPIFFPGNRFFHIFSFFSSFSCVFWARIHCGIVPHCLGWIICWFVQGVGLFWKGFSNPLDFGRPPGVRGNSPTNICNA
jgi:hypothetical protein